jgi:hypothetical protein
MAWGEALSRTSLYIIGSRPGRQLLKVMLKYYGYNLCVLSKSVGQIGWQEFL